MWDFICSRPLCALLPRFTALRCLALTGYNIDLGEQPAAAWPHGSWASSSVAVPQHCVSAEGRISSRGNSKLVVPSAPGGLGAVSTSKAHGLLPAADLHPLGLLPRLEALHLEAEALPGLAGLPPSLRHLSLSCFANAARYGTARPAPVWQVPCMPLLLLPDQPAVLALRCNNCCCVPPAGYRCQRVCSWTAWSAAALCSQSMWGCRVLWSTVGAFYKFLSVWK